MSFGARALIRLDALNHNLNTIRRAAPEARTMAVIKANAYGHGLLAVAEQLTDVDAFAVARLAEGLALRSAGIDLPVTLLSGVYSAAELQTAVENDFDIVVHSDEQVVLLDARQSGAIGVWLKINTGMNRLGFSPERAIELIPRLRGIDVVGELRLMTHFADADDLDRDSTLKQLDRMRAVARGFDGSVSIANSPAALGWPEVQAIKEDFGFSGDVWIRPGIALFGISPFPGGTGIDLGLRPVMQFEAKLIARRPLAAGSRVGYAGRYVSDSDTELGIIAAGYGDGYTRHFRDGTPVLINGRRAPLIGNVSMDMIAVDLGPGATDRVGDVATLWGDGLPVEEVAPWAGAIPYELVCGVMNRESSKLLS